jgi:hypothetical protein
MRALRPLRMMKRFPGLKAVLNALLRALPAVSSLVGLMCFVQFIVAVIAVDLFKGSMESCQGEAFDAFSEGRQALVTHPLPYSSLAAGARRDWAVNATARGMSAAAHADAVQGYVAGGLLSRDVCGWMGAEWGPANGMRQSFDTTPRAMMTLFEMSTTEGWVDMMWACTDSVGVGMQPVEDYAPSMRLACVGYLALFNFFFYSIFTGVIVDKFNSMKKENMGESVMMTAEQLRWIRMQQMMQKYHKQELEVSAEKRRTKMAKKGPFRRFIQRPEVRFVSGHFINVCIGLNVLVLAAKHFAQPDWVDTFTIQANYVFSAIFTIEAAVKIWIMRTRYWSSGWNRFDFVLVVVTNALLVYTWLVPDAAKVGPLGQVVRSFRMARVVRLVKTHKKLKAMFNTLLLSLPAVLNVATLMCVVLFIYASWGVQVFARVGLPEEGEIGTHANFQSFGTACLTLLRCATGEAWNEIMHDLAAQPEGCVNGAAWEQGVCGFDNSEGCAGLRGCGSPTIAYFYFVTYQLVMGLVFLNLFATVVIDGFSRCSEVSTVNGFGRCSEARARARG